MVAGLSSQTHFPTSTTEPNYLNKRKKKLLLTSCWNDRVSFCLIKSIFFSFVSKKKRKLSENTKTQKILCDIDDVFFLRWLHHLTKPPSCLALLHATDACVRNDSRPNERWCHFFGIFCVRCCLRNAMIFFLVFIEFRKIG